MPHYGLIGKGQYSGVPSLAIAYDLKDIMALGADCLNALKAVVVDADNLGSFIESNLEEVRALRDRRIPMIVIVSNANSETALHCVKRDLLNGGGTTALSENGSQISMPPR